MLCLSQLLFWLEKEMQRILGHHCQAVMHSLHCMPTQTLHSGGKIKVISLKIKLRPLDDFNWK
jgi:hypothetical protein